MKLIVFVFIFLRIHFHLSPTFGQHCREVQQLLNFITHPLDTKRILRINEIIYEANIPLSFVTEIRGKLSGGTGLRGFGNQGIYHVETAKYPHAVLKIINAGHLPENLRVIYYYALFNKRGFTPKFYGVVDNGKHLFGLNNILKRWGFSPVFSGTPIGLVMEKVDVVWNFPKTTHNVLSSGARPRPLQHFSETQLKHYEQFVKKVVDTINDMGLWANDLQFFLDRHGKLYLADLDLYQYKGKSERIIKHNNEQLQTVINSLYNLYDFLR